MLRSRHDTPVLPERCGSPVANLIHYGCHGTAAGKNTEISRDWSGIMTDALERKTGAVTAFLQGTAGDVGPRISNGKTVGSMKYVEELGNIAARDACALYDTIRVWRRENMAIANRSVSISLKPRPDRETARREYEKCKDQTVNLEGRTAHYWKQVLDSYGEGYGEQPCREVEQILLRLGDVAFASMPYEVFSEIGLRIAADAPVPYTRILTCTNGNHGYFVTRDQICRGGYEVKMFLTGGIQPYGDDADFEYVTETLRNLKAVADCGKE